MSLNNIGNDNHPNIDAESDINPASGSNNINHNTLFNNNPKVQNQDEDQDYPDSRRMFVRRLPVSMDELQLKEMFEKFERVREINLIRYPQSGKSKGCCIVEFYTRKAALKVQEALHNNITLEGMRQPIRMAPAYKSSLRVQKLYVGNLSDVHTEHDVRQLFAGHGVILECTILVDSRGQSKRCAFVTFETKQEAIEAMKSLNHCRILKGCSRPLVVKFADTVSDKYVKRMLQHSSPQSMQSLITLVAEQPAYKCSLEERKLFVKNLSDSHTAHDVRQLFADHGVIEDCTILLDSQGQSKRCALVTFETRQEAIGAIESLHYCKTLQGCSRPLVVKFADTVNDKISKRMQQHSNPQSMQPLTTPVAEEPANKCSLEGRKVFVGNLSDTCTEHDVRQLFAGYGVIEECKILLDSQGQSKCSAFVTFQAKQEAIEAIKSLHHSRILESCSRPIVVKFADTVRNKNSKRMQQHSNSLSIQTLTTPVAEEPANKCSLEGRKLFVGNLSDTCAEHDVRQLFTGYGVIEECKVLLDSQGQSKCSAFVTFQAKQEAIEAIKSLHHSRILEGCSRPLVVKFADTVRNKNSKRKIEHSNSQPMQPPTTSATEQFWDSQEPMLFQGDTNTPESGQMRLQQLQEMARSNLEILTKLTNEAAIFAAPGTETALPDFSQLTLATFQEISLKTKSEEEETPIKIPEVCNLLVSNMPPEITDHDLARMFCIFGKLVFAKVFIDEETKKSSCYGIVSFSRIESAKAAIRGMDGIQVGFNRLKVQLNCFTDAL